MTPTPATAYPSHGTPADRLAWAADQYLKEVDNPVPDYLYRRNLREALRKALTEYQDSKT